MICGMYRRTAIQMGKRVEVMLMRCIHGKRLWWLDREMHGNINYYRSRHRFWLAAVVS